MLRDWLQGAFNITTAGTGIVNSQTSMKVSQRGAGANQSVDIAAGAALTVHTETTSGGLIEAYNDAAYNIAVTAADGTNARKDLVILHHRDSTYSGANDDAQFAVVAGTPAASPAEPDPAAAGYKNYQVLAMIDVPAGSTSVIDARITDRRSVKGRTGTIVSFTASGTFSKASYPGLQAVIVEAIGSGGNGAGADAVTAQASAGSGGGAGGYAKKVIRVSDLGTSETVTVGSTAAVGTGDGASGSASSFGSFVTANGGTGGTKIAAGTTNAAANGGDGGTATGGDINVTGGKGGSANRNQQTGPLATSGVGGVAGGGLGSPGAGQASLGSGGNGTNTGLAATGYGAGGGGAITRGTVGAGVNGGAGGPGIVVVTLVF